MVEPIDKAVSQRIQNFVPTKIYSLVYSCSDFSCMQANPLEYADRAFNPLLSELKKMKRKKLENAIPKDAPNRGKTINEKVKLFEQKKIINKQEIIQQLAEKIKAIKPLGKLDLCVSDAK